MARKNRKTRKEKQLSKKHEFNPYIRPRNTVVDKNETEGIPIDKNKPQIPAYIYKDFKKITTIMAGFIIGLVALAVVTQQTDLLNPVFAVFHIKY